MDPIDEIQQRIEYRDRYDMHKITSEIDATTQHKTKSSLKKDGEQ